MPCSQAVAVRYAVFLIEHPLRRMCCRVVLCVWCIQLVGEPQVGKSSLALFWAYQTATLNVREYFGRQWAADATSRAYTFEDVAYYAYVYVLTQAQNIIGQPWAVEPLEAVIFVYSVDNRASFDALTPTWLPFIQPLVPTRPIFLVGLKKDLREQSEKVGADDQPAFVSFEEGMQLAAQLNALSFTELNTSELSDVNKFWDDVIRATVHGPLYKKIKAKVHPSGCVLL